VGDIQCQVSRWLSFCLLGWCQCVRYSMSSVMMVVFLSLGMASVWEIFNAKCHDCGANDDRPRGKCL